MEPSGTGEIIYGTKANYIARSHFKKRILIATYRNNSIIFSKNKVLLRELVDVTKEIQ